jgi:hypothetical protein
LPDDSGRNSVEHHAAKAHRLLKAHHRRAGGEQLLFRRYVEDDFHDAVAGAIQSGRTKHDQCRARDYQLPTYLSILGGTSNIFGVSGGSTKNVILATAVFQTEPYGS